MKLNVISITDIDLWKKYLINTNSEAFFQDWAWADIEARQKRTSVQIAVTTGTDSIENIKLASHVVTINARRGTYLHVRHGPVYHEWSDKVVKVWLDWMRAYAKRENACAIRISPMAKQEDANLWQKHGFIPSTMHLMDGEVVARVGLGVSDEVLLKNMKKNTRNLIRKSTRIGIDIVKSNDIDAFLQLYQETSKRHGFVPHSIIRDEYIVFNALDQADLLFARYEGKYMAGALIIYHANQAFYRHGASLRTNVPVAYALQWDVITRAKARGYAYYNMFGIADTNSPNHPWAGLTKFKLGFGGEVKTYMHAHDLSLSPRYKLLRIIESYEKKKRGY